MKLIDDNNYLMTHRRCIHQLLGKEFIQELHQTNKFWDTLTLPFLLIIFFTNCYLLNYVGSWLLFSVLVIIQGFIIQTLGLYAHEMCTHRKVGGQRLSYIINVLLTTLTLRSATAYEIFHINHHKYLNTNKDPETHIVEILENLKIPGWLLKIIVSSILSLLIIEAKKNTIINNVEQVPKVFQNKINRERMIIYVFITLCFLSLFFTYYIWNAYLLPLILIGPFASLLRTLLEHLDVDKDNPLQCATYYKTNFITRGVFFFDSGDCHLIHHIYPRIPFYKMKKAIRALEPYLLEHGVTQHHSLLLILYLFYFKDAKMREKITI